MPITLSIQLVFSWALTKIHLVPRLLRKVALFFIYRLHKMSGSIVWTIIVAFLMFENILVLKYFPSVFYNKACNLAAGKLDGDCRKIAILTWRQKSGIWNHKIFQPHCGATRNNSPQYIQLPDFWWKHKRNVEGKKLKFTFVQKLFYF